MYDVERLRFASFALAVLLVPRDMVQDRMSATIAAWSGTRPQGCCRA